MKFLFFIFIILIGSLVSLSLIQAVGFSPSSLIYELEKNQEECKMITLTSDSETIGVSDKWAENKDIEWKVSLFDKESDYHGISIDYDNELSADEKQVEVCLSGQNVGEYHGVILLKQEQEGNSIVQMGIWLKVTITEPQTTLTQSTTAGSSGGGGGGGGGGSSSYNVVVNITDNETLKISGDGKENNKANEEQTQETTETANQGRLAGITGAVIGGIGNKKIIGISLAVIIIAGIVIYNRRKKE